MPTQQILKKEIFQLWRTGTKPRTIEAAGVSMRPLIMQGSRLTFFPAAFDRRMSIGDIALFERDGRLIAHRIVGRFYNNGQLWLREKGDSACSPASFPEQSLIGRVVLIESGGRVHDLSCLRLRVVGRLAGLYWCVLFALLRILAALRRVVFSSASLPRLRSGMIRLIRLISRLPTRFLKP